MGQANGTAPPREIELDLLRGIAILAVLDQHSPVKILSYPFVLLGFPSLGSIGVNIFFVLSGFLVGGLLVKEWRTRGRVDSKRFLIRRGFKIWPQFYLFLLVNLLTGHRSIRPLLPAFLNVQNYFYGNGSPPHLWSLAVEEHAYLLLTFLLAVAWRLRMRMRSVFLLLAVLCVLVISTRMIMAVHGLNIFAPTQTRIAGIFYGVMLAILFHCVPSIFHRLQSLRWLWALCIVGALAFIRFHGTQLWTNATVIDASDLIGISSLMLVYRHRPGTTRPWPYRLIAWIGLYSYGTYLWGVAVLTPVEYIGSRLPTYLDAPFVALAGPMAGIALGVLVTKLVEFPMLRLRDHLFPRRVKSAVEDTPTEAAALTAPDLAAPLEKVIST